MITESLSNLESLSTVNGAVYTGEIEKVTSILDIIANISTNASVSTPQATVQSISNMCQDLHLNEYYSVPCYFGLPFFKYMYSVYGVHMYLTLQRSEVLNNNLWLQTYVYQSWKINLRLVIKKCISKTIFNMKNISEKCFRVMTPHIWFREEQHTYDWLIV